MGIQASQQPSPLALLGQGGGQIKTGRILDCLKQVPNSGMCSLFSDG